MLQDMGTDYIVKGIISKGQPVVYELEKRFSVCAQASTPEIAVRRGIVIVEFVGQYVRPPVRRTARADFKNKICSFNVHEMAEKHLD